MTSPIVSRTQVPDNIAARFWARVYRRGPDECWEWQGSRLPTGYGQTRVQGAPVLTHRLAYALQFGEIPAGLHVLHHCDNPPCVNPRHLYAGSHADNMADKVARGRCHIPAGSRNPQSGLHEDLVVILRARRAKGESASALAAEFGLNASTVRDAVNGRYWKHVGAPCSHGNPAGSLTAEDIIAIRRACAYEGKTRTELAATYGKSESLLAAIIRGEKYAWAGGPLVISRTITEVIPEEARDGFGSESQSHTPISVARLVQETHRALGEGRLKRA